MLLEKDESSYRAKQGMVKRGRETGLNGLVDFLA
jgi:hypothetical protein